MQTLKTLVIMQLRNIIDFSFLKKKKKAFFMCTLLALLFVGYCIGVYFIFNICVKLNIFSLLSIVPESVIIILFTVMFSLSLLSCIINLTKNLYFGSDNSILLTLPCNANIVFFSKLIVFYIIELVKNIAFMVPVFVAYGMMNNLNGVFYIILVIGYFFISMLPVILGALISIPSLYIVMLLRNKSYIQFAIYLIIAGAISYFVFVIIAAIPENFNLLQDFSKYFWDLQDFLNGFVQSFMPMTLLTRMIIGHSTVFAHQPFPLSSLFTLLAVLGIILVCGTLVFFLSRPIFFRMASKPFEYKQRRPKKEKPNRVTSPYLSALKKEIVTNMRNPGIFIQKIAIVFVLPLTVFLLNKIFASMDTRLNGNNLCLAFTLLMILLLVLTFDVQSAHTFSSEGSAHYLLHTTPVQIKNKVLAKISINALVTIVAVVVTCALLTTFEKVSWLAAIMMLITTLLLYGAHLLWSLEMDMMHPKWTQYRNEQLSGSNSNETKSSLLAFGGAIIFFFLSLLLLKENPDVAWYKIAVFASIFFIARLVLFGYKAKIYFNAPEVFEIEVNTEKPKGGESN